jgi:hypothetical protein
LVLRAGIVVVFQLFVRLLVAVVKIHPVGQVAAVVEHFRNLAVQGTHPA